MPRQHVENTKEFWSENEAKRANKHANKRIIYWPPFWNKVYVGPGNIGSCLIIKMILKSSCWTRCQNIKEIIFNLYPFDFLALKSPERLDVKATFLLKACYSTKLSRQRGMRWPNDLASWMWIWMYRINSSFDHMHGEFVFGDPEFSCSKPCK